MKVSCGARPGPDKNIAEASAVKPCAASAILLYAFCKESGLATHRAPFQTPPLPASRCVPFVGRTTRDRKLCGIARQRDGHPHAMRREFCQAHWCVGVVRRVTSDCKPLA